MKLCLCFRLGEGKLSLEFRSLHFIILALTELSEFFFKKGTFWTSAAKILKIRQKSHKALPNFFLKSFFL